MRITRRRLTTGALAALVTAASAVLPVRAMAGSAPPACATTSVLVLTAMPLELNPIIAKAHITEERRVNVAGANDRRFYVGTLGAGAEQKNVVLAMTGIGLVNATQTTEAAFGEFGNCFSGIVFSGVAGSIHNIGDVAIPAQWTHDPAKQTWYSANRKMLKTANAIKGAVQLSQDVPVGDAACLCPGVDARTPVRMPEPLHVYVGGQGTSYDTFSGHSVPCLPGGGDIAGCRPCVTQPGFDQDAADFAENMPGLLDPAFFAGLFAFDSTTSQYESQDEETAAVADVAFHHGNVPFLGIRAVSDGGNDPLHLPGFPFQFATYRQLAGNNAAAVALKFLATWTP